VIHALSACLKLTAVGATGMAFMGCPPEQEGCQENHTYTAIDDNCGQTPYVYATLGTVPVYRTKAVTNVQAEGVKGKIVNSHAVMASTGITKNKFNERITAVYIVSGSAVVFGSDGILRVGYNAEELDIMLCIGEAIAQLQKFNNAKETVRIAIGKASAIKTI